MKNLNVNVFQSKLQIAESGYNSAFSVISKIQKTSDAAAVAAGEEAEKAEKKRLEYEVKAFVLRKKMRSYTNRSQKIANFIQSLDA